MSQRFAIVGGGPAGLFFAVLAKRLDPTREVTVWERNAPHDTFGFGVVFSDETLEGIHNADPTFFAALERCFARWTDIDVHYGGDVVTVGGQGFAAVGRKEMLHLLQRRAIELGVVMHHGKHAPDVEELSREYDLVVGADGVRSRVRERFASSFVPTLDDRHCRYMWLGVDRALEAFTFFVKETPWGVMQVHAYPYSASESTFLVEMHEDVWRRAGLDAAGSLPPGLSDDESVQRVAEIFAAELDGSQLLSNSSRWVSFSTVRNESWRHENVVLVGDAAHTAHFSIGSGTKLALEDALALAACVQEQPHIDAALEAFELERRPVVLSLQRAAQASLEWFENIGQYMDQEPVQFAFNLMSRSRRITFENVGVRDPGFGQQVQADFAARVGGDAHVPALFQPLRLGGLTVKNRVVVSPMDMYSATDGVVGDFHLVHLGGKALGGAGLVMTEMIATSPQGRITLGDAGLWNDEQAAAWGRVVDFVHQNSTALMGAQIGHSGRKGATKIMWEGIDDPLEEGGWVPVGPSPIPYGVGSAVPRELTREDVEGLVEEFVQATHRAEVAGFDVMEIHAAHGYLLSSFLSPLANVRTDEFGGSLENRLRFPLRVVDAVRAAWPSHKPLLVRISAHDWAPGGNTDEDAVIIAAALIEHGVDGIDVSSGQVVKHERPEFGRSFQSPFADKVRNRVAARAGVPVIAVGAVSSFDDVNSLILAGRADAVALGRTHLWDPQWTLHAAADMGYRGQAAAWPLPFAAGSRKPPSARTDAVRPRLELVTAPSACTPVHTRWVGGHQVQA